MREHFGPKIEEDKRYLDNPEDGVTRTFLHKLMDDHLEAGKNKKEVEGEQHCSAVGYGLLSRLQFVAGVKPDHVLDRTKLAARPAQGLTR